MPSATAASSILSDARPRTVRPRVRRPRTVRPQAARPARSAARSVRRVLGALLFMAALPFTVAWVGGALLAWWTGLAALAVGAWDLVGWLTQGPWETTEFAWPLVLFPAAIVFYAAAVVSERLMTWLGRGALRLAPELFGEEAGGPETAARRS